MIRRPPRSTQSRSSAASDVYKRQGENAGFLEAGHVGGQFFALEAIDGTFRRGPDGELEALHGLAVPELDGPHDIVGAAQRDGAGAQGHDVRIVANFNGLLGADLHAVVAFPALVRLLVCLLYTSNAADDLLSVDLGGSPI